MRHTLRIALYALAGTGWTTAVAIGGWRLWAYDSTAGAAARPPLTWPSDSRLARRANLPALVLLVHPHCPCSRATIGELSRLMTDGYGKMTATVVMLRASGTPPGWEQTDLWRSAAAIPGVNIVTDEEGRESRRFRAATSGQALLYGADGRLLFSGGITESRGHSGDNAGRSAILALILGSKPTSGASPLKTPVYGCPLFNEAEACLKEGGHACPN